MLQAQQVTIIGAGLLGASLGLALRGAGYKGRLVAQGRNPASVADALALGAFDHGTCDPQEALAKADLVVVCVPLGSFEAAFRQIEAFAPPTAIVTDAGSAKTSVANAARRVFKNARRVIGAHPMAGGEKSGPSAARADLFAGKPCVLTVCDNDEPRAIAEVEMLWGTLLNMRLLRLSPEAHDRAVAAVSHLPHLASLALAAVGECSQGMTVASTGYRDATRLAAGNAGMWADIFLANREATLDALAQFKAQVAEFEQLIETGDRATLEAKIAPIAKARSEWKGPQ